MNLKALFLITILLSSFLVISFDNVNAGHTVDVKEGKIHMDAYNSGTGFLWHYRIGFVDAQGNIFKVIIKTNKGCFHDEYYDIPSNTALIRMDIGFHGVPGEMQKDIAAKTCGFKMWGSAADRHVDYNYYELDGAHETGDRSMKNMAGLGWDYDAE